LAEIMKDRDTFWVSREEYQEKGMQYCITKLGGENWPER